MEFAPTFRNNGQDNPRGVKKMLCAVGVSTVPALLGWLAIKSPAVFKPLLCLCVAVNAGSNA